MSISQKPKSVKEPPPTNIHLKTTHRLCDNACVDSSTTISETALTNRLCIC